MAGPLPAPPPQGRREGLSLQESARCAWSAGVCKRVFRPRHTVPDPRQPENHHSKSLLGAGSNGSEIVKKREGGGHLSQEGLLNLKHIRGPCVAHLLCLNERSKKLVKNYITCTSFFLRRKKTFRACLQTPYDRVTFLFIFSIGEKTKALGK